LAKNLLDISFGLDDKTNKTLKSFFEESEDRVQSFMQDVVYDVNEFVMGELKSGVSQEGPTQAYKESLAQKDIEGAGPEFAMNIIMSDESEVSVSGLNGEETLVSFIERSKNPTSTLSSYAMFLTKNGAWPLGMITHIPNTLKVVFESATVMKVSKTRDEKMALVAKASMLQQSEKDDLNEITRAIPNIGYVAVATEFSLQGFSGGAHWRPAISKVQTSELPKILENALAKHLDPRERDEESKTFAENINIGDVKEYGKFQKLISG
jgi:hypothetical protein